MTKPSLFPPTDFLRLACGLVVADVRTPSEFKQGHIPGAVNLPLFSDEEHAAVGTVYVQESREKAVRLGFSFVGPRLEILARDLLALCKDSSRSALALYCKRGGMRSGSVAWLCETAGIEALRLEGGYKAFRRHVLESLDSPPPLRVLGGRTGSGKTEALREMAALGAPVVDLEGLARHRGSAFGAFPNSPQPTNEQFENDLCAALAGASASGRAVWVEDESENLGTVNLPRTFLSRLKESPLVLLECSAEARLRRVIAEYGGIAPEIMEFCLHRIRKKLGGLNHKNALACLAGEDFEGLARILLEYYDRAYDRQLEKRVPLKSVAADRPDDAAEKLLREGKSD